MIRPHRLSFPKATLFWLALGALPLASQTPTESQFIASVNSAITTLTGTLGPATTPIIYSGNLVQADGKVVGTARPEVLLDYVDGLKAAGVQRVDLNPGVTTITNPATMALYDAVVQRIRQLGLQLAINPEFTQGELGQNITFQDFQNAAIQSYTQLAVRYQPENFVIVHEPTTADASMGLTTTQVQDWHNFIVTLAPLIKAASPRTRVGAGGFQDGSVSGQSAMENMHFQDFVTIPALDFMTMDVYNDDTFSTYNQWIQLAKANHKGVYIEEVWAPHYLPNPLPAGTLSPRGFLTKSLDDVAVIGAASSDFAAMDTSWLHAMSMFASANGMEAITAFTTQTFFALGTAGHDKITDPMYGTAVSNALQQGQLTTTAQGFLADSTQFGIKVATTLSSASYATLPSVFEPNCGSAMSPCNANSTVAPDELVSGFGANLATSAAVTPSVTFPTTLAGTTVTLVDGSNTVYKAPLYSVASGQVNYLVPSAVKPGPAVLTIANANGTVTTGIVLVSTVEPGIYTANANGTGVAAAIVVTGHADGSQSTQFAFTCASGVGSCAPLPISLGSSSDTVVLELFGTGVRHLAGPSAIQVQIRGQDVPVLYAGPQGGYTGLDQINVQIPRSLMGSGVVNLSAILHDTTNNLVIASNTVTLAIQ